MDHIAQLVRDRRSVRTFDDRPMSGSDLEKLQAFMENIENPYGIPVTFKLLPSKEYHLSSPVISGGDMYVGATVKKCPYAEEAFGYSFEVMVLYALSLGIGTVLLGGTMDRGLFERAMDFGPEEMMPCVSPLGYPAQKMSLREVMMRKAIKADTRFPFEEIFFEGDFNTPLTKEKAGQLTEALEMVRLAPSAVNKQPWRVVLSGDILHFYMKQAKGYTDGPAGNMQKIDIGIALSHFALSAKEQGIAIRFQIEDPGIATAPDIFYMASYQILS